LLPVAADGSWEGWTRERAENELQYIAEQIRRGE
jgi:hypothetical protein